MTEPIKSTFWEDRSARMNAEYAAKGLTVTPIEEVAEDVDVELPDSETDEESDGQ